MGKQASKRSTAADTFTQTIIIIQLLCPTSDYLQSRVQGEREREMWMCVFKRSCMSRRKSKKCVCALPCATQLCNLWLEQIEIERESESVCLRVIVCVCREILCLSVWTEWSVGERTSAWEMEAISYFCGRLLVVVVVVVKQAWQAEVLTPILQAVISKSIHSPIRTVPLSLSPSLYIHTHSHGYFKKYPLTCKKYMQPTYLRTLFPFHSLIYWPTFWRPNSVLALGLR